MGSKNKNKKSHQEKLDRDRAVPKAEPAGGERKVLMRFAEHKYYNDLDKPHFESGKVYELTGEAWIQRWLKRGGMIVEEVGAKADAEAHNPPPEKSNPVPVEVIEDNGIRSTEGEPEELRAVEKEIASAGMDEVSTEIQDEQKDSQE